MSKAAPKSGKPKSNEDVFAGFQNLRTEQRQLANKITELEMDLNEHKIVIETLEGVNKDRKCFRMVGGVLVERTVNDVLPELTANRERLPTVLLALNEQLAKKGKEVNEYMEQHEIRVQRNAGNTPQQAPAEDASGKGNVLVAST